MEKREKLNEFIRGTCMDMCPMNERNLRKREKLLHPREILEGTNNLRQPLADPEKTVKAFSRSAAGRKPLVSADLRPLPVLEKTVRYLFSELNFDKSKEWTSEYDFIFDRIRAIHQDAVIQGICSSDSINLYESIARFLVYSGYRLCSESRSKYDPVINVKHLKECLKKVLVIYDEQNIKYPEDSSRRHEIEALYLVVNMGDTEAISRGVEQKGNLRSRDFEIALDMSLAFWHGHYVRVIKLLKELPLLLSCAASLHIPVIRRKALKIMCTAYSSKNLSFPINDLQRILQYSNKDLLMKDCEHYKLPVQSGSLKFLKGSFSETADVVMPVPLEHLDERLRCIRLPGMLLTGKED